MKNLILSAMMLTGVVTFAQETPKKATKDVKQTTSTSTTTNPATQSKVTKVTEAKTDANGDKQVETTTTTKAMNSTEVPVQGDVMAPRTQTSTTTSSEK